MTAPPDTRMINAKIIFKVLGSLLILETLLLLGCLGLGIFYKEENYLTFSLPAIASAIAAITLKVAGRHAENRMSRRDGFLCVSLSWLAFSTIGMLPFIAGGYETRIAAAFFESMSGFSTTGATVFTDVDALPHSILFWRSLTNWFGGMGIVFFTLAVLPTMGTGDLKLFSAEATGLKTGKLHPRIGTTARWLWGLYLLLTVACSAALYLSGMNLFDAINHGMSTIATGGFSTHTESIGYFRSPLIEYVEIIFMYLASINFTLLYLFFIKRRWQAVWRDGELRCLITISLFTIIYTTVALHYTSDFGLERSFRYAAFHTVSLQSTTGFTSYDFMAWHPSTYLLLLFVSSIGSCAGSTSGGIKCIRIITAYKIMINEFKHMLHPRAVLPVRINQNVVTENVRHTIFAYFVAFFLLIFCAAVLMSIMGIPLLDSVSLGIASFCNTGPSIGHAIGPTDAWNTLSDTALWINSFLMLAGRLEIFSLLLPFIPAFWRDN